MKVAVFGAGTMGRGIAQVFAQAGHETYLYASNPASAQRHKDKLAAGLQKRVEKGKMTQEAVDAILNNIKIEEKAACADCDLILETVKEDMATKKVLLVLPEKDEKVILSARNIPGVKTALVNTLNVYDVLNCDKFIVVKSAVAQLEEVYK